MKTWEDSLCKAAIALALLGFLATFAISYRSAGLADGLAIGEAELDDFKASIGHGDKIRFSADGEGTYAGFARRYGWIAGLFGIATLALLISRFQKQAQVTMAGLAIAVLSSLFILYQLRQLIRDKTLMEPYFWEAPRNRFAFQTITYDWLMVGLTCFLVISIVVLSIVPISRVISETKTAQTPS